MNSEAAAMKALAQRFETEGHILAFSNSTIGIFEPLDSILAHEQNYKDLQTPQGLGETLRFWHRPSPTMWSEVRAALTSQARFLNQRQFLRPLYDRLQAMLRSAANLQVDLTTLIERSMTETLLPIVLADLDARQATIINRMQSRKLRDLLMPGSQKLGIVDAARGRYYEISAGRTIAEVIRSRLKKREPTRDDFLESLLTFEDRLSVNQLSYVITTILTAIAGAPGSVASCVCYELCRHPEWREKVRRELTSISLEALLASPVKGAPISYRFLREAMRRWSFPLMARRRVRADVTIGSRCLAQGDGYIQSSFLLHHDKRFWHDPERFDPDRWLDPDTGKTPGTFVPFGWAPRTCIGASIGLSQLMLFLHIISTQLELEPSDFDDSEIGMSGFAIPRRFSGTISPIPR